MRRGEEVISYQAKQTKASLRVGKFMWRWPLGLINAINPEGWGTASYSFIIIQSYCRDYRTSRFLRLASLTS